MKKLTIAAAAALAFAATPAMAQSAQERLDVRYNRALAAGYKALMLCSAIANAERNGVNRSPAHIIQWELTGIQSPLNDMIPELNFSIIRGADDKMHSVRVEWAQDANPRIALHQEGERGCSILPLTGGLEKAIPEPPGVEARAEFTAADIPYAQIRHGRPNRTDAVPDGLPNAFDAQYGARARTTAVLIVRNGETVSEAYAEGFGPNVPQRTWSVAKSIAATLMGAAMQGKDWPMEALNDTAGIRLDDDPRRAITIDHALRMASGRYSDTAGNRTDPLYWGGTTVDERAQNWPVIHTPGTVYRYSNNDTLAAVQAIEKAVGRRFPADFFDEIGMNHTVAETDWQGNYVLSSQVWSTANDLAKLGQLYLNNGVWNGARILPEGWREYVSDPSGPQPQGTNWGYGAGWWTFKRPEGNAFEGIPDDAFAARGNRGQYVVVVPSRNVVIVRRGEDMVGTRFDIAAFTRDVLAALEE